MTRKVRVIQFGLGMPHDQYVGGAEVFAASLAQALDQDRFELLVCGMWQFNSTNEALQRNALAAKNIASKLLMPYDPNIRSIARAVQPFVNLVRRWQADIVTTHAEYADLISLAARQLHQVRYTPVRVVHLLPEFDIVGRYHPALAAALRRLHPLLCSTDIGIYRTGHIDGAIGVGEICAATGVTYGAGLIILARIGPRMFAVRPLKETLRGVAGGAVGSRQRVAATTTGRRSRDSARLGIH